MALQCLLEQCSFLADESDACSSRVSMDAFLKDHSERDRQAVQMAGDQVPHRSQHALGQPRKTTTAYQILGTSNAAASTTIIEEQQRSRMLRCHRRLVALPGPVPRRRDLRLRTVQPRQAGHLQPRQKSPRAAHRARTPGKLAVVHVEGADTLHTRRRWYSTRRRCCSSPGSALCMGSARRKTRTGSARVETRRNTRL